MTINRDDVFQSTRPRGARRKPDEPPREAHGVSIHAPTRGATRAARNACNGQKRFNPRAHAGRDMTGSIARSW